MDRRFENENSGGGVNGFDQEVKNGRPYKPELHELLEKAIATAKEGMGDPERHATAVLRSRWYPAI